MVVTADAAEFKAVEEDSEESVMPKSVEQSRVAFFVRSESRL